MKLKRAGKDATPADGAEEASTPKSGSNNLIPAIVIAVGLLGGGFFMSKAGGGTAEAAAPPAPATHAEVAEEATHGPVQNLEPITLNLADGHFLKVGLALQLAEAEGGGGHGGGGDELPAAKALDIAISLLGTHTMDDLAAPKARELVKKELSEKVSKAYTDPVTHQPMVTKVYFTEFVMQ